MLNCKKKFFREKNPRLLKDKDQLHYIAPIIILVSCIHHFSVMCVDSLWSTVWVDVIVNFHSLKRLFHIKHKIIPVFIDRSYPS